MGGNIARTSGFFPKGEWCEQLEDLAFIVMTEVVILPN